MYIVVVGGGKVGYHLTKTLLHQGYEVLLIEKDKARYEELADKLGPAVMLGDGTWVSTLKKAGVSRADTVVAVAGDDQNNLVICQLAKGVFLTPKTIARVSDPENEELFKKLGIDFVINSTKLIFSAIEYNVTDAVTTLLSFDEGKINIVQAKIEANSKWINKRLMDIPLPKDCVLISIIRQGKVILPRGTTTLQKNDIVLALTSPESQKELNDILYSIVEPKYK
jgi:trk system potassium uptake protein TrkA